jgi:hypothetical protein
MNLLKGAARIHKKQFEAYVNSVGVRVQVRQPSKTNTSSTAVSRAIGVPVTAEGPIGEIDVVQVVWTFGYTAGTNPFANPEQIPPAIRAAGTVENVDAVLRCKISDVLVTAARPGGRTLFDSCKDIVYEGTSYKVIATDRTGLPPEGPYVCWVAVKANGASE